MPTRVTIAGIPIDSVDLAEATAVLDSFVRSRRPHQVVTVNLDFLALAERLPRFRQVLTEADLALADGQPLVWLARRAGAPLPGRVAGIDLLHAACALAAERGYRPFLLGAGPGVADEAAHALEARYPGLRVAGAHTPPFGPPTPDGDYSMAAVVRRARPDLLFVALGAPRQDLWISNHLADLRVPVCMGVGGSLDFVAGRVPRAPEWMQGAGLEWLFRMAQEPGRLWRRYVAQDMPLMLRLLAQPPAAVAAPTMAAERLLAAVGPTEADATGSAGD